MADALTELILTVLILGYIALGLTFIITCLDENRIFQRKVKL